MKTFLLSFMLLFTVTALRAQNCTPLYIGKDDFTTDSLIYYGGELDESGFFSDKNLMVGFMVGKNGDSLNASIVVRRQIMDKDDISSRQEATDDLQINKGQSLYLSLSNGEAVRLTAKTDSKRERKKVIGTIVISTTTVYYLTPAQTQQLGANTITGYRIELAQTLLQNKKLKPNKVAKMQAQLQCAAQRFSK